MSDISDVLRIILEKVEELAREQVAEAASGARENVEAFLNQCKFDLERWAKLAAKGELSKIEVESLVKGQFDLGKLHALTDAGIAQQRAEKFRRAVIDIMVDTLFQVLI